MNGIKQLEDFLVLESAGFNLLGLFPADGFGVELIDQPRLRNLEPRIPTGELEEPLERADAGSAGVIRLGPLLRCLPQDSRAVRELVVFDRQDCGVGVPGLIAFPGFLLDVLAPFHQPDPESLLDVVPVRGVVFADLIAFDDE